MLQSAASSDQMTSLGILMTMRPVQLSMRPTLFLTLGMLAALYSMGCAGSHIPNTVERVDIAELLNLASPAYYDDNGTPVGGDDIDFDTLRNQLAIWPEKVIDVRYEISYRSVEVMPDRIYVGYRYTASFRVETADGNERWFRRLGDNRIVISRTDDGGLSIISGM
jgi:hypothetical protein